MKQEFKAGDKVYCPKISNEVHVINKSGYKSIPYEVLL